MTFQFQRERRQSLMNPDTNLYVHEAQGPSESQAKATVPKSLHFSPVPHGLLMPGDPSMSLSHDTHHRNVWISSHPLIWRDWFQFRVLPILTPFLGPVPFVFFKLLLETLPSFQHRRQRELRWAVSGFRFCKAKLFGGLCDWVSVSLSDLWGPWQQELRNCPWHQPQPGNEVLHEKHEIKNKLYKNPHHLWSGNSCSWNQPTTRIFFLWCLHKDLPLDQYSELWWKEAGW